MTLTIVFEILVVVAVLTAIAIPLFRPVDDEYILAQKLSLEEGDQYHQLLYKKENFLSTLKDLEFEYETGKLSKEDFDETKEDFELKAIQVIKEIEEMEKAAKEAVSKPKKKGKQDLFCTSCGKKVGSDAKFCPSCGKQV